jgi:CRISPR-associated protein (TIGR03986 family)
MAEFVNPYTFVPLPESVERRAPAGHDQAADDAICGSLTVTWTLQTPLLLPKDPNSRQDEGQQGEKPDEKSGPAQSRWSREGKLVVPGSTMKGSVRSLHETLMGGCLRVFDADFLPVYRQPAVAKGPDWRLGVVEIVTRDGRPTQITMTERTAWVPVGELRAALGRAPQTGDTVDIPADAIREDTGLQRFEVVDPDAVGKGDRWVVVVGDSGTRQNTNRRRDGSERRFLCAAGRLPDETQIAEVSDDAWEEYVRLCEGTDDLRRIRQDPEGHKDPEIKGWRSERRFRDVKFQGAVVGRRRMVTGRLWAGDVVWARVDAASGEIHQLSMAAIWRVSGHGPLGERVPECLHPCQKWDELCLSCRMFGSADTTGATKGGSADQQAYAGHVRVGDAIATKPARSQVRLAPLAAPRPGAGQFYLQHERTEPARTETQLPSAYWGAERHEDQGRFRPVRGRKHYWHGDPSKRTPPRHKARQEQRNEAMTGDRTLVSAGTMLTQKIAFDNLSMSELGSLLLALCPGLDLPGQEPHGGESAKDTVHASHLGGGKPFGLGSVTAEVTELRWSYVRDRYAGRSETVQPAEEFFTEVRAQVRSMAGPARQHWPTVSRILRVDAVDPELIWYPLGGEWGDETNRDRAFRYFARTNGQFYANRQEPIVPLPDPAPGNDQALQTVDRPENRKR